MALTKEAASRRTAGRRVCGGGDANVAFPKYEVILIKATLRLKPHNAWMPPSETRERNKLK